MDAHHVAAPPGASERRIGVVWTSREHPLRDALSITAVTLSPYSQHLVHRLAAEELLAVAQVVPSNVRKDATTSVTHIHIPLLQVTALAGRQQHTIRQIGLSSPPRSPRRLVRQPVEHDPIEQWLAPVRLVIALQCQRLFVEPWTADEL
jgi:hypothetical protein